MKHINKITAKTLFFEADITDSGNDYRIQAFAIHINGMFAWIDNSLGGFEDELEILAEHFDAEFERHGNFDSDKVKKYIDAKPHLNANDLVKALDAREGFIEMFPSSYDCKSINHCIKCDMVERDGYPHCSKLS